METFHHFFDALQVPGYASRVVFELQRLRRAGLGFRPHGSFRHGLLLACCVTHSSKHLPVVSLHATAAVLIMTSSFVSSADCLLRLSQQV